MLRVIGALVVVAALVFGVGYAAGWWTVEKGADGGVKVKASEGTKEVLDKGKKMAGKAKDAVVSGAKKAKDAVASGAKKAKDAVVGGAKKLKDKITGGGKDAAAALAGLQAAVGKAGRIETVEGNEVTFAVNGEPMKLDLSGAAVTVNGEAAALTDLEAGDNIEIKMVDGKPTVVATR